MGKKYKDVEIGDVYGRWTVIGKGKIVNRHQYWWCKCSCGNSELKEINGAQLKNGRSKSCGCYGSELPRKQIYIISFYDWCIENNYHNILNLWDYELNKISPKDIGFKSNRKFYFKCPSGLHKSQQHVLCSIVRSADESNIKSLQCNECNSFGQYLLDTYGENGINLYWDYNKNTVNPFELARALNKKVWIKCQEKKYHDSYSIRCSMFLPPKNSRCPYCAHQKNAVHKYDSLGFLYPQVLNIWSDKNKKSYYEYLPFSGEKVWWKCQDEIHEDFSRTISAFVNANFNCPYCSKIRRESFLQEATRTYIEGRGYCVNTEFNCSIVPHNPKNGKAMPFDNEVVELNLIIEVHGIQHYRKNCTWHKRTAIKNKTSPEIEFNKRRLYDRYKKAVAECNGYFYLEIPYWTEKDESYKKLIDDKINEILIKQKKSA